MWPDIFTLFSVAVKTCECRPWPDLARLIAPPPMRAACRGAQRPTTCSSETKVMQALSLIKKSLGITLLLAGVAACGTSNDATGGLKSRGDASLPAHGGALF